MSVKKLVFISHITAEKEIALSLKRLVDEAFMGMIDVFVSSDPKSIAMGGRWLNEITQALKACAVEIILAGPKSIQRPWINFEAGAGWIRDVPVIPICHSGITPATLPPPLSSLQGGVATDAEQLQRVFDVLATAIGCKSPVVDFTGFIQSVKTFEDMSRNLAAAGEGALTAQVGGLQDQEIAALVATAECTSVPGETVWPTYVRERMSKAGYREVATSLGLAGLKRKGLIEATEEHTGNFNETSVVVALTEYGWTWLEEHVDLLDLKTQNSANSNALYEEEIPF